MLRWLERFLLCIERVVLWAFDRRARREADAVKEMYTSTHAAALSRFRFLDLAVPPHKHPHFPHKDAEIWGKVEVPKVPSRDNCACAVTKLRFGEDCLDYRTWPPRVNLSERGV